MFFQHLNYRYINNLHQEKSNIHQGPLPTLHGTEASHIYHHNKPYEIDIIMNRNLQRFSELFKAISLNNIQTQEYTASKLMLFSPHPSLSRLMMSHSLMDLKNIEMQEK